MIIELYGLPGAGKTTFAEKMAAESGYKIIKIRSKIELLRYNFVFLWLYPVKFCAGFYYIVFNSPDFRLFYYKFMNIFLHHNAKYIKARKFEKAIIDQGHFMNIISLFETGQNPERIKRYANFLPKPDILLVLDPPDHFRRANLMKRGYSAREELGKDYAERWETVIARNNRCFLNLLNEMDINYKILKKYENCLYSQYPDSD